LLNYMLKYKIPQIVTLILNPSGFYVDPRFLRVQSTSGAMPDT
jgi:hypothetical protein